MAEHRTAFLSTHDTLYCESRAESIHRFDTHAIETDRLLKRLRGVLGACIHFRRHVHHLTERHTASEVSHHHLSLGDLHDDLLAVAHHEFVDRVVHDLFQKHIDAVVIVAAVTEFAYIHAGAEPYMLLPVKSNDIILRILCHRCIKLVRHSLHFGCRQSCLYFLFFCHFSKDSFVSRFKDTKKAFFHQPPSSTAPLLPS